MAGDKIRNQLLGKAGLLAPLLKFLLKLLEQPERRFAHDLEYRIGGMFGRNLEPTGDVLSHQLTGVFLIMLVFFLLPVFRHQQIIAHTAGHKGFLDFGMGGRAFVDINQRGVVGVEVVTDVDASAIPNMLTAQAHGWSDDDGDAEQVTYQWHNQDGLIADATDVTLSREFSEGETFFVEATPFDGMENGETVRSASIVIPSQPRSTDVNGDGVVNILDLVFVANNLGIEVEEGTGSNADVNGDNVVNILDLVAVAADI